MAYSLLKSSMYVHSGRIQYSASSYIIIIIVYYYYYYYYIVPLLRRL
jgi:hypothetical protein